MTETLEPMTTRSKVVDCSKARTILGHRDTVDLKTGLAETRDWMRSVYSK
jgi:nucleoside-diphosphate-sugar epimerase